MTTEIYTLSLHDALPICDPRKGGELFRATRARRLGTSSRGLGTRTRGHGRGPFQDRKSTRLNSRHLSTSYAVFCLKKKSQSVACLAERCLSAGRRATQQA